MKPKNDFVWLFLGALIIGSLYLIFTYKTPYEKACIAEKEIKEAMSGLHEIKKDIGIPCSEAVLGSAKKDDILLIKEQFVVVDSAYNGYIGIASFKGDFILSNFDVMNAGAILYKKDDENYLYAKFGMKLEEVKFLKEKIEKSKTKKI